MQIPLPTPSCSHFTAAELPCSQCDRDMRLVLIEPKSQKLEQRTYVCAACGFGESFLLAV